MKKVALLISGRVKGFDQCIAATRENLLNIYQPTIFASVHGDSVEEPTIKEFAEAFRIPLSDKHIVVSKYRKENPESGIWNEFLDDPLKSVRYASQFYHLHNAFELLNAYVVTTGESFDAVIRWRADIYPYAPFPIDYDRLNDNIILVPQTKHYNHRKADWIPDQNAVCTFNGMQKYCSVHKNAFSYFDQYGIAYGIPENTLFRHMEKCNVTWTFFGDEWGYDLYSDRFLSADDEFSFSCVDGAGST